MTILVPIIPIILWCTALIGCVNHPPPAPVTHPAPTIPLPSQANVRVPEKVKAYPVNRYVDPSNPRQMHERHVVYRVEQDARWRTQSNAGEQILIGPTMTASRADTQRTAQRAAIASFQQESRNLRAANEETRRLLTDISLQIARLERDQRRMLEEGKGRETVLILEMERKIEELRYQLIEMENKLRDRLPPNPQGSIPNNTTQAAQPEETGLTPDEREQLRSLTLPLSQ